MQYWLMKSEPDVFGIDHLQARPRKTEPWDGVRNYQARNFMRDMRKGDQVFFYHSSCPVPGIVGIMEIVREAFPDPSQFDPESKYYDPRSEADNPRWSQVEVKFVRKFAQGVSLERLRNHAGELGDFKLLARGSRLSVIPVSTAQWQRILALESQESAG